MFERFRDAWERRKIEKHFAAHFKKAADEQDQHRMDRVTSEANFAFDLLRSKIAQRETNRLWNEAEHLDLETPLERDDWIDTPAGKVLSPKNRSQLRKTIDEEKTRRREVKAWWWKTIILPAVTLGIGIIGALTGLVAVFKKH